MTEILKLYNERFIAPVFVNIAPQARVLRISGHY